MKKIFIFITTLFITAGAFCSDKSSLKFRLVREDILPGAPLPENCEEISVYEALNKKELIVEKELLFDGSRIKQIELIKDSFLRVQYGIQFTFDEEGKELFSSFTEKHIGEKLLVQAGNSFISAAVIRDKIVTDQVVIWGIQNLAVFQTLKETFDCIDNTELNLNELQFNKSVFASKPDQNTDLKNPVQVIHAFLYYYILDNPEWKKFIYDSDNYYIEKLEKLRKDFYLTITSYEVYIPETKGKFKIPPAALFKEQVYFNTDIPFKLVNQENTFIQNIHLVVNKEGEYYFTGIN